MPLLLALWARNYSVYGRRKLTKAARKAGHDIGRDQVARLMRQLGIRGASRARKRFTTRSDPAAVRAPDLLNRDFTASRPNQKWVADFTYCSTWSGIVYVAFVIDVSLLEPGPQRLRADAQLAGNPGHDPKPLTALLGDQLPGHPHRPLTQLWRIPLLRRGHT